MEILNN